MKKSEQDAWERIGKCSVEVWEDRQSFRRSSGEVRERFRRRRERNGLVKRGEIAQIREKTYKKEKKTFLVESYLVHLHPVNANPNNTF